ncbi:TorF family putative porin [Acanthopleuribacter pedis]|uniref:TIGR02001 family outer membrane protein n=1 Tax=Acanthopleuribacter pedis TaxID=442870 RepID=A0A8J7U2I2_9BACT|nr:hypothetical protein [Acanthopleuribacter pedis]
MKWFALPLCFALPLFAQISFNAALTSDYVWRGVSQTDEAPALQLGIDWKHDSGFYLGGWGSNVDFGDDTDYELDALLGYANELDSGFSYDLGYVYYFFEGGSAVEFGEAYLALGYRLFSLTYARDLENDNGYIELGLSYTIAERWTFGGHYGDYQFDGGGDYQDYALFVTRAWGTLEASLTFTDTDLDGVPIADSRVFATLAKTW